MGRPRKAIDLAEVDKLAGYMRAGAPLSVAAAAVGWSWESTRRWLAEGRKLVAAKPDDQDWRADFARKAESARATGRMALLARIREGKPGWQGAAWFLERYHGAQIGRPPESDEPDPDPGDFAALVRRGLRIAFEDRNVSAAVRLIELLPKEADNQAVVSMADVLDDLGALPAGELEALILQLQAKLAQATG